MSTSMEGNQTSSRAGVAVEGVRAPLILAQFSTRLPPSVLERLRVAAPQLGLRQSDITAAALDEFLRHHGF